MCIIIIFAVSASVADFAGKQLEMVCESACLIIKKYS